VLGYARVYIGSGSYGQFNVHTSSTAGTAELTSAQGPGILGYTVGNSDPGSGAGMADMIINKPSSGPRTRTLWVPASSMAEVGTATLTVRGTSPAVYVGRLLAAGADNGGVAIDYRDNWRVTSGGVGTYRVFWAKKDAGTGNVRWSLNYISSLDAVDNSLVAAGTEAAATGAVPSSADAFAITDLASSVALLEGNIRLVIRRLGTHGDDTYAGDVMLLGVAIAINADI